MSRCLHRMFQMELHCYETFDVTTRCGERFFSIMHEELGICRVLCPCNYPCRTLWERLHPSSDPVKCCSRMVHLYDLLQEQLKNFSLSFHLRLTRRIVLIYLGSLIQVFELDTSQPVLHFHEVAGWRLPLGRQMATVTENPLCSHASGSCSRLLFLSYAPDSSSGSKFRAWG